MLNSKFEGFLSFLQTKKRSILITTHHLVDIDGLASCFNLKYCLNQILEQQEIRIHFSALSKPSKEMLEKLTRKFPDMNLVYDKEVDFSGISVVIVVDTNNLNQTSIKDTLPPDVPIIFLDHHFRLENKKIKNEAGLISIISDEYSSTAEIILEFCEENKVILPKPYRVLMIAAILTDSGFFNHGNNNTIKNVGILLDDDLKFQEIVELLKYTNDISEKMAIIKGMKRVELIREKDWLIGVTRVSSFEASVASSLVKNGFDVGIVVSDKKSSFRISTRARKGMNECTGLHLGKILDELSEDLSLSGGGHDSAASINGEKDVNTVLDKLLEKVKQNLIN